MTKIHEGSQDFEAKIPSSLKIKADEIVKDILTKGAAGAKDYSFIDDAGKTLTADQAQKKIDAVNRMLFKDKPEGYIPTEEEKKEADTQVAIIQNTMAGGQDTPKSNTLDYVAHKLIEIYALPTGEMTSYGFKVTPQMKDNIIKGLVKQYNFFDRLGTFKAFFIGGKKTSRYGDSKPTLPRKTNGQINWELFNDLYVATSADVNNEKNIKNLVDYYITNGMSGSFSGLLNVNASRRYTDAYRRMNVGKRGSYNVNDPNPSNDPAFRYNVSKSTGDKSLSDPLGDDGDGTLGDTIPSDSSSFETNQGIQDAMEEVVNWIRTNRSEHDAQAFEGLFVFGMKPKDVIADPRFPLVTDQKAITDMLTALKVGKFPQVFKSIIEKHTDIDTSNMDIKQLSSKIFSARADQERKVDDTEKEPEMSKYDMDYYFATGKLPNEKDYEDSPETVDLDSVSDEELNDLYESVLMERVKGRLCSLIAETVTRNFFSKVDALLQQL